MTTERRRSLPWLPVVGLLLGTGFAALVTAGDVLLLGTDVGPAVRDNALLAVVFAVVWSLSSALGELRARRRPDPSRP